MRLDMHSRREILKANFEEYHRASKRGREGSRPCGKARRSPGQIRGRVCEGAGSDLGRVWQTLRSEAKFPQVLVPMIRGMIDVLVESENPQYPITEELRMLRVEVSAVEAGLLLKPTRQGLTISGVSTTRSVHTPLRSQIPVVPLWAKAATAASHSAPARSAEIRLFFIIIFSLLLILNAKDGRKPSRPLPRFTV